MRKWLIVGAGLAGCTIAERIAAVRKERVLVVEKKEYVGGMAADYRDDAGILRGRCGAHIFHTNDDRVWNYVNEFADFGSYKHRVFAETPRRFVELPPDQVGEAELAEIYRPYSERMWGCPMNMVDPMTLKRASSRQPGQVGYFNDKHQGLPEAGYSALCQEMLDDPLIEVSLETQDPACGPDVRIIWTGPIDAYFGYAFGRLPYRSLRFEWVPASVLNRPREKAIREVCYPLRSVRCREYPEAYAEGRNDPLYPVVTGHSAELLGKYRQRAAELKHIWFLGRQAEFLYLNMDQTVGRALKLFDEELRPLD